MINWVLNHLNIYKYELGMDSNSFYPMIFTNIPIVMGIIAWICTLLKNCFNKVKEYRERKIFELYCESESDNFYCVVIFGEVLIFISIFLIFCFLDEIIVNISFFSERQSGIKWEVIISGIISLVVTIKTTKMNWIRKRLLGDKEGKRIVLCSIFLINIAFICGITSGKTEHLGSLFMFLYLILEIKGLLHFWGRYTKYDYSSMKLHLDNGDIIVCEDIEKVVRKKDYISVESEGRNIILQYNKIWEVEYYGEPKVILKKYWHL